ncbi:MAG: hypothetical protein KAH05_00265 [Clostridiales bacterium]|nr:hypothetical protein [Clostridiales bacterium]
MSKYIMENKNDYYRLLREVQIDSKWEEWILYILKGVQETSKNSLTMLIRINELITETTDEIKSKAPNVYSYELVELLFSEFYTRISSVEKTLGVTRKTASSYLKKLVEIGILDVESRGRENVYINRKLIIEFN